MKTKNLSLRIVIALVLGITAGSIFNMFEGSAFVTNIDKYFFNVIGQIFLNLIFMLVVPVVFVSIVLGVVGVGDPKLLGGIGLKTITFFLTTTALAIIIGIALALIFKPGAGKSELLKSDDVSSYQQTLNKQNEAQDSPAKQTFDQTLINLFPKNPIQAMTDGNMLQIITFAIFIGIGIIMVGSKADAVYRLFDQTNEVLMFIITMIMNLFAPIGTFGLVAHAFTGAGFGAIQQLGMYFFIVLLALAIHFFVVYGAAVKFLGKYSPAKFFKGFIPAITLGFSASSSNAALPVSMNCTKKMGVRPEIASFVQPLGATINMDGTAIMQGVATIFIAQISGANLTFGQLITVVIVAVVASIGTAGVPGVGLIMLAMVLNAVDLNPAAIGIILGIDRLLDMTRTSVNITGDAACALIVSNSEEKKLAKVKGAAKP
ncbi:dicarboxylate/amino acid:cation symporter [Staphylococcus gallinarum]|jgi:Na+/H+-dicarboxylate symporter|uniref:Dicarboxylate/amino acid:cation symporter n=1 Tax=Staphylococcus gallinarum TaxID=1293 RepID=A0A2T4SXL3_STAGA|nr:dicarboxylate/amino acid:cation symporter [Staphylococcus gallinarum]MCD8819791.1 dicarboxylate/amino acid:cation symporter [Staphylococcus gallinarum]MCD8826227.1 dicarboxylate/amino acid:cation symporter [Staphylococcus gallinarum]MCD8908552.1 dicarboxylate/amino acid:cation symporter [Staphylococcus gallinarum]MCD8919088.1 dicarboxylate/amino acid:cation symporter [Staphylococcus gallinarum]MCQ9287285.1 dicarboxylate/amino acid:cation symporter [Staphylococcus gallinarum]